MPVTLSLIGGITNTGDSVSAGGASIFAALSIEGDDNESQTIGNHTYGSTSFTNSPLVKTGVGTNAIYAHLGHIESPASGPETYTSTLSSSPPSIGQATVLLGIEGGDASDLIDDAQTEHFAQSGVNVFPTHTFSAVSGQAVLIVVQANKSGDITPPADNGSDSWTELLEPWFIGGAFADGAVFKLEATETHSSASATPGDAINGFICSSHMYVFNEDSGGATPLLVDDISQSQSIDQPSLTQANILSVNDLDQSQSIDSPILTQAHNLTVNDITQSQTIDNITLSVSGALLVNDLTQSQTIDLANIIQNHILLVNGLDQSQSIDEPALIVGITVDDITQAQTLDAAALVQANILSVDDLTQAQLLDNVYSGEIVVGSHKGEVLVFSAYNGIITSTNAHTGEVKVFNAVDIT